MKKLSNEEIKERVLLGMKQAHQKLLAEKQKNDQNLILYERGKIVKIKARDLKS